MGIIKSIPYVRRSVKRTLQQKAKRVVLREEAKEARKQEGSLGKGRVRKHLGS